MFLCLCIFVWEKALWESEVDREGERKVVKRWRMGEEQGEAERGAIRRVVL